MCFRTAKSALFPISGVGDRFDLTKEKESHRCTNESINKCVLTLKAGSSVRTLELCPSWG